MRLIGLLTRFFSQPLSQSLIFSNEWHRVSRFFGVIKYTQFIYSKFLMKILHFKCKICRFPEMYAIDELRLDLFTR